MLAGWLGGGEVNRAAAHLQARGTVMNPRLFLLLVIPLAAGGLSAFAPFHSEENGGCTPQQRLTRRALGQQASRAEQPLVTRSSCHPHRVGAWSTASEIPGITYALRDYLKPLVHVLPSDASVAAKNRRRKLAYEACFPVSAEDFAIR